MAENWLHPLWDEVDINQDIYEYQFDQTVSW
jgi:hypothetical protein